MFTPKIPYENSGLEKAIDDILVDMQGFTSETEEYAAMAKQLTALYSLKDAGRPSRVSPDTMAIVAGNLLGILVIVGYERASVVTSKGLSLLLKAK